MSLPAPDWQSDCGRVTLYQGDCLNILPHLAPGSVDAIVTDPPYGTTAIHWDYAIDFDAVWSCIWRTTSADDSPAIFTARQPFTTKLIASQFDKYRHGWVWDKKFAGAFVLCNVQPLQVHEDICVFGQKGVKYRPQMIERNVPIKLGGKRPSPGSPISSPRPDSKTYKQKYPTSIINISNRSEPRGFHPTQKPVALFEYIVRTYSDDDDTVLDPFMGSGTTGVACVKTGRKFIGIELEPKYFEIAKRRISEELAANLFLQEATS